MGDLILCSGTLAELPFYIDKASLNVYSLEELAYYIENNIYLLGQDFMKEELCAWVGKELGQKELADKLREICEKGGTLSEFVVCLLSPCSYCSGSALRKIEESLREMEHKSEFECCKIRADRYMENQKYVSGLQEYRKLLQMKEETEKNPILFGNVLHNLGTAYARLFLFEEAAVCYENAYKLNGNPKSLKECIYAYRCRHDEEGCRRIARENGMDEETLGELCRALTNASRMEQIQKFESGLEELFADMKETPKEQEDAVREILDLWKREYRRNCRV